MTLDLPRRRHRLCSQSSLAVFAPCRCARARSIRVFPNVSGGGLRSYAMETRRSRVVSMQPRPRSQQPGPSAALLARERAGARSEHDVTFGRGPRESRLTLLRPQELATVTHSHGHDGDVGKAPSEPPTRASERTALRMSHTSRHARSASSSLPPRAPSAGLSSSSSPLRPRHRRSVAWPAAGPYLHVTGPHSRLALAPGSKCA